MLLFDTIRPRESMKISFRQLSVYTPAVATESMLVLAILNSVTRADVVCHDNKHEI
jgi:hypothetical protein